MRQASVDKLDILFAVDNSASMGDKQLLLAQAVPDLVARLVTPNCVDDNGAVVGTTSDGKCANGKAEFQPVHDMHLGIVSSSLGGRGGDICDGTDPVGTGATRHDDDQGHLLGRGSKVNATTIDPAEGAVPDMGPSNYLAWLPDVDANKGKPDPSGTNKIVGPDPNAKLNPDFVEAIGGVHEYGCGIEAQLESWYRFLIQPDPYNAIIPDPKDNRRRALDGVDGTIIRQRHDFLRPDSLVAIILLSRRGRLRARSARGRRAGLGVQHEALPRLGRRRRGARHGRVRRRREGQHRATARRAVSPATRAIRTARSRATPISRPASRSSATTRRKRTRSTRATCA